MAEGSWVERCGENRPRAAKISFSSKLKIPSALPYSGTTSLSDPEGFNGRYGVLGQTERFFARMGGFPEEGLKWFAESVKNINNIKLNVKLSENLGGALHGMAQRVSLPRKRGRRQLGFARVAASIDPGPQEKLEEVKDDVLDKAQELKEDVVDTAGDVKEDVVDIAQTSRVPVPSTSLPYIGFIRSLTVKDLLCGVLAGGAAATIAVPFDVVRTRVIAGQGGQTTAQVFNTVIKEEGLQSIMKGNLQVSIIINAVQKGLQFTTFEAVKRYQKEHSATGERKKVLPLIPRQIPVPLAGGAAGGLMGTLLGYPIMPIIDRTFVQSEKYKSIQGTAMEIIRNEGGVRELYRGITPALIAIVPTTAISFYTYETLKAKFVSNVKLKPQVEALRSLLIGAIAGAVSTTVTYPLELARKEILLSALSPKAVQFSEGKAFYSNTWQALHGIFKAEGVPGLYRGLLAQNLQIVPMTAITFMVYELTKRAFVARGEESRDEVLDIDDVKK